MLEIRRHEPGKDLQDFVRVPHLLLRDDPKWVPSLDRLVEEQLTPGKNPFFEHAEVALFTAWQRGRRVGRISAQVDREHLRKHGDDVGFFGFFDTVDDAAVGRKLVDAAAAFLAARGMRRMRGPLSLSINEEVGMLVDGFDDPPMMMCPHHARHQKAIAEAAGLDKAMDLFGWRYQVKALPARVRRAHEAVRAMPNVRIRTLDKKNAEAELAQVLEVGEPAAICFAAPNLNEATHDLGGKLSPVGAVKLGWRMFVKKPKSARLILLGVKQKYRAQRQYGYLPMALVHEIKTRGEKIGYEWGELGWTLESNAAVSAMIKAMGCHVYKTYRLFEKPLA